MCKPVCGSTSGKGQGLGRAFLPQSRDCSKCHRTLGKTDKMNISKPWKLTKDLDPCERPSRGGRSTTPIPLLQLCSAAFNPSSLPAKAAVKTSPAATGKGRRGVGPPEPRPLSEPVLFELSGCYLGKIHSPGLSLSGPAQLAKCGFVENHQQRCLTMQPPSVATCAQADERLAKTLRRPEASVLTSG